MSIKIVAELLCGAYRLLGSDFDGSKMTVNPDNTLLAQSGVYVVVEFYPWFKFYFPLFWGIVMSLKKKENNLNQG